MRYVIVSSESADVAHASGTAVAIARLRRALAMQGVSAPVMRPRSLPPSQTLARRHFDRAIAARQLIDCDAVLGVNGDGWRTARHNNVPFVALVKAFYAGAARYERGTARRMLQLHARWEQQGVLQADAVVVPSGFAATAVIDTYGVERERVHVMPEPFDVDAWRQALPHVEREDQRVLCVARLYPRKRIGDLLRAWPAVVGQMPSARLDIAGGGPELRRLVADARGVHGVRVHGHVDPASLPQLYARASIFCLPSGQETFGYAAVEAMASGLTLVVSDSGALPEMVTGADADVVREGDPAALTGALVHALQRPRVGADELGVRRARDFDPQLSARRLIDVMTHTQQRQRRAGGSASRSAGSRR